MRSGVAILGLLAACYAPTVVPGARCSTEGHCPDPLACIDQICQLPGGSTDAAPHDSASFGHDGALPPDGPVICPAGYTTNVVGTCYRSVGSPKAWVDAEHVCEQDGAHLVVIQSAAEGNMGSTPIWIGVSDRITEGTFRAVTGPVIAYQDFGPGQPSGAYDCVHVGDPSNHTWSDGPCDFPFPFLCEYDGTPADPTAF